VVGLRWRRLPSDITNDGSSPPGRRHERNSAGASAKGTPQQASLDHIPASDGDEHPTDHDLNPDYAWISLDVIDKS